MRPSPASAPLTPSSDPYRESGWLATDGIVAIGPVPFELLLRRIAEGRLQKTALIRHESWQVWRTLGELANLSGEERARTLESYADLSAHLDERASGPGSLPPPAPSSEELSSRVSLPPPGSSRRPVDPVGVLAQAKDLRDALLLTLSTVVAAARADVGLYHRLRPDLDALVVAGAHGGSAELLLGEQVPASDPTWRAVRAGATVLVEPCPGEVGRHILGRLGRCIPEPRGAALVPLTIGGNLVAVFEIARSQRLFSAREIGRVEDIVEALGERIVIMGWHEDGARPTAP
jgi:hypothetical protein